jgi:hypothetical protein
MPTEVLHALYDGGAGAGLDDYWKAISTSPVGGGAFIWDLADEGIARSDRGGAIDVFSTYAPDGVVGPHDEKEGSYYTIRDLWSPVQVEAPNLGSGFDGTLAVTNRYDFTALSQVNFQWELVRFPAASVKGTVPVILSNGQLVGPAVAAHASGTLKLELPKDWRAADALMLTAIGPDKQTLWTWSWPISEPSLPAAGSGSKPAVATTADGIRLNAGAVSATFDPATGSLRQFKRGGKTVALSNGPRLVFEKLAAASPTWLDLAPAEASAEVRRLATPQKANLVEIDLDLAKTDSFGGFKLEITADEKTWKTVYDSTRRTSDGIRYPFPPQLVSAVRISHAVRASGAPAAIKAVRVGFEADRFVVPATGSATVTTGTSAEGVWVDAKQSNGLADIHWTLRPDGSLKLDYRYDLSGDYIYHGVTFDHGEDHILSVRSLGEGPYRVWQNRLRGTALGVRDVARHVDGPEALGYPEFQGYFAGLRWARFNTDAGPWQVTSGTPNLYLRVGTPPLGHSFTSPDFPTGDVSFMSAIPAIGSKFVTPEKSGPASQPAKAAGTYSGSILFTLPTR